MITQTELDVRWNLYVIHAKKLNELMDKGYEVRVDDSPLEDDGEIVIDEENRIISFKTENGSYPMYDESDSDSLDNIATFFADHVQVMKIIQNWAMA